MGLGLTITAYPKATLSDFEFTIATAAFDKYHDTRTLPIETTVASVGSTRAHKGFNKSGTLWDVFTSELDRRREVQYPGSRFLCFNQMLVIGNQIRCVESSAQVQCS
jgi:hypothetical protein